MTEREEQGSLILALAVILVLSGLSLAVLARTISALTSARLTQDSAAAVLAADTGLTDALYVLGHTAVTGPTTLSGAKGPYSWTAVLNSARTGTVTSTGTVNGHSHSVQAQVQRPFRWPWLVATAGSLVLDGTDDVDPPTAFFAAGGQMVLRNGAYAGVQQDLLGIGASCSGCSNEVPATADETLPDPVVPTPAPSAPTGGCVGIASLTTGTYLCPGGVSFATGAPGVTVGPGQVDLYVTPNGGAPAVVTFAGATVNPGGNAAKFIVHVVGAGVIQPGDGASAGGFTGVLDAPRSSLRSAPCQLILNGAADLGSFDCVTGAGLGPHLRYSSALPGVPATAWQALTYSAVS